MVILNAEDRIVELHAKFTTETYTPEDLAEAVQLLADCGIPNPDRAGIIHLAKRVYGEGGFRVTESPKRRTTN